MVRRTVCLVAALGCWLAFPLAQGSSYDRFFTGDTMRVDYVHGGGPAGESIHIQRVVDDGPWAGSVTRLLDTSNLGEYQFEVRDGSDRVIYSRGFGSIYGEWTTTPESKKANRTFEESVRFPWPRDGVRISWKHRDANNVLQTFWLGDIRPDALPNPKNVAKTPEHPASAKPWTLLENGPAASKVDLLLISDGYSTEQLDKFHADARRLLDVLFTYEPYKSRKSDFNVRAIDLPVEDSPVHTEYNIFDLDRYMLTYHDRALRDAASLVPYDIVSILVNQEKYGGGGIFNDQAAVAVDTERAAYVFAHELSHEFAGLGDEYVGSVTYETGAPGHPEPWEPNLTALLNPAALKWRDLVEPGTPIPTPPTFAGKVGAFEGGMYEAKGIYRPEFECIMGTNHTGTGFCQVCQRAIRRMIDLYTRS